MYNYKLFINRAFSSSTDIQFSVHQGSPLSIFLRGYLKELCVSDARMVCVHGFHLPSIELKALVNTDDVVASLF